MDLKFVIKIIINYSLINYSLLKSHRWESNSRPLPYQGSALPLSYDGLTQSGVFSRQSEVGDYRLKTADCRLKKERKTGLEPATWSLEGYRSTKWATSAYCYFKCWMLNEPVPIRHLSLKIQNIQRTVGRVGFEPTYSWENRFTVCRL